MTAIILWLVLYIVFSVFELFRGID
jgi:hypothetical protein